MRLLREDLTSNLIYFKSSLYRARVIVSLKKGGPQSLDQRELRGWPLLITPLASIIANKASNFSLVTDHESLLFCASFCFSTSLDFANDKIIHK